MTTKIKGSAIKSNSIPIDALEVELKEKINNLDTKLTELSAEVGTLSERVDELEKGSQGGGASVEGQTLIFSASSSAQVIGNTLKL